MKYLISKTELGEPTIKEIEDKEGNKVDNIFSYEEFIIYLYNNKGIGLDIIYDNNINDDEKNKIDIMVSKIKEIFKETNSLTTENQNT